jgi:Raf kinase inhibitor-like YbhB/YbcL family protein
VTDIQISSSAFTDHEIIPERLSKLGGNVSPPLVWSGIPQGATELVLLCEDPDAPSEKPWLHWLVTGIDPSATGIAEGQVPDGGREWTNDFGETGWGGPQPPEGHGPHRYFFRLYALDSPIELPEEPSTVDVHRAVDNRALATGVLVGTFER